MHKDSRLAKRTSVHLDIIRGVSALAVMLGHLRGLFFANFSSLANRSVLLSVFYAVTGFGHQAVMVFFVLSGYFIGTSVMESVGKAQWSWRTYLASRMTRLYLVLFPALILGAIWDRIGMRLSQAVPLYYGGLAYLFDPSVAIRSTVPVFFGNFFFLQGIVSPVFGSNGPLWSLSYEFWYYIIFPSLILAMAARLETRIRILYAGIVLFLLWSIGLQLSVYFPIWLAGALGGRLHRTTRFKPPFQAFLFSAALIFFGVLAWSRVHQFSSVLPIDYLVALCFGLWLYALLLGSRDDASPAYVYVARKAAGFSYTLYLLHFPILLLFRALLNPQGNWQPDPLHLAYGLGIGLLVLIYAYVVAEFTEARTARVRRRLLQPRVVLGRGIGS